MRSMNTIAGIDIGSNAIRLLISNVENSSSTRTRFRKVAFLRVPVRLGEDVFRDGRIGDVRKEHLCEAFRGFSHLMKAFEVKEYRAYATSAMREAQNSDEVIRALSLESGLDVTIINGQQEADIIYEAGGLNEYLDRDGNYLYVDVGGGSTEVVVYSNRQKMESCSFRVGTVRMLSNAVKAEDESFFERRLKEIHKKYPLLSIIAFGGNINKIHKLLEKRERESLSCSDLKTLFNTLEGMTYEDRIRNFKMNPYRADVIVPALKIFLTVSKICQAEEIIVPKMGLVDGIVRRIGENFR